MNKKKLLALLVSSAFLFAACGDDDSPSSPKNNETEISSSSEADDCDSDECEEKSSSSKSVDKKSSDSKDGDKKSSDSKDEKKSSSSTKDEKSSSSVKNDAKSSSSADALKSSSSSAAVPEGPRAAKLTDLEKNIELKLFDQTVYLSTGSKQGLIALRIPDELWLVTYTDFANGEVKFVDGNVGKQYAETDAVKKILEKLKDGFTISFIVDENGKVKYAVGGSKEYSEAVKASVAVQQGKVSKAEDLKNKIYKCTDGDTTRTFTFFDNSYIVENAASGNVAYWIGGHYDIQRSTLLMRPAYYNKPVYSMYAYSVGTDNSISMSNGETTTKMNCQVESVEYEYEKASDFVGEWQKVDNGIEWSFTLKADGSYELSAFEGQKNVESKSGSWEIYGYHLMMRNSGCLHPDKCTSSIHGQLQAGTVDRETNKISGFSFIHSDPDTPKIPTSFEAPQYE